MVIHKDCSVFFIPISKFETSLGLWIDQTFEKSFVASTDNINEELSGRMLLGAKIIPQVRLDYIIILRLSDEFFHSKLCISGAVHYIYLGVQERLLLSSD